MNNIQLTTIPSEFKRVFLYRANSDIVVTSLRDHFTAAATFAWGTACNFDNKLMKDMPSYNYGGTDNETGLLVTMNENDVQADMNGIFALLTQVRILANIDIILGCISWDNEKTLYVEVETA